MTTNESEAAAGSLRLRENMDRIEALTQRLVTALAQRGPVNPAVNAPGPDLFARAAGAYLAEMMKHPARIVEQQAEYWGKTLAHYIEAQQNLVRGKVEAPEEGGGHGHDRRFANPLWQTHPYFAYLKQQYLLNAETVAKAVAGLDDLDPRDRWRIEFFARQIVDMMAPTNFLATNPDALERAVETDGESLVRGLENLVHDIESNQGELLVTLSDPRAFSVGENLGVSPGAVVFRNKMFELIQYAPSTERVHRVPLLVFPPWINKFYILDMKPANSLVKWIVDQGFTLFVVSWVNPDPSYADTGMDDYIRDGYLAAIEAVKAITGEPKINAVGYCIAGTTLGLTLAHLQREKDRSINCATFFTTLTDFSDQGEVGVFLDDDFVNGIEHECAETGILHKKYMSRTFSFLRANDLIYTPAIRSYMMGESPPAFDLLYWNGDGTNLPGRMAMEYLRGLCQRDEFAQGRFKVLGHKVSLGDIRVPVCAVACETDHIAAWRSSFNGVRQFGSKDKTFILSESGHIAGIVNPPGKGKYGHYVNPAPMTTPEEFRAGASYTKESWWPRWGEWLAGHSGGMVPARVPGSVAGFPALAPAPGTYVTATPQG
jgi:polyhydroxyalkanoate synthase